MIGCKRSEKHFQRMDGAVNCSAPYSSPRATFTSPVDMPGGESRWQSNYSGQGPSIQFMAPDTDQVCFPPHFHELRNVFRTRIKNDDIAGDCKSLFQNKLFCHSFAIPLLRIIGQSLGSWQPQAPLTLSPRPVCVHPASGLWSRDHY